MNFSASASSSSVRTPGLMCSPTSASVSATTSPAFAICSTSAGDLRMIIAPPQRLERGLDLGEHLVDRALGVDHDERRARAVVLDERLGLGVVELEALLASPPGCRRRVPRARRASPSARGTPRRRGAARTRRRAVGRCRAASRRARPPAARLRGKPSRTKPSCASSSREALADDREDQVVGDELPRVHDALHLEAERRACGDLGAQDVARRDVREPVVRGDPLRLGSLAGPLGAEEQDVHATSGSLRSCASSSATASGASCRARRRRRSARTCRRARARSPGRSRRT